MPHPLPCLAIIAFLAAAPLWSQSDAQAKPPTQTSPQPSDASSAPVAPGRSQPDAQQAADETKDKPPLRVRVRQSVLQDNLIHQVQPVYPAKARHNHIQGSVVMKALIGKDGHIEDLQVLSGPKELVPAAIGAVQQWRYRPWTLKGEPVEIESIITVNFHLLD